MYHYYRTKSISVELVFSDNATGFLMVYLVVYLGKEAREFSQSTKEPLILQCIWKIHTHLEIYSFHQEQQVKKRFKTCYGHM